MSGKFLTGTAIALMLAFGGVAEADTEPYAEYIESDVADLDGLQLRAGQLEQGAFSPDGLRETSDKLLSLAADWAQAYYGLFHRAQAGFSSENRGCSTTVWARDVNGEYAMKDWAGPDYAAQLADSGTTIFGHMLLNETNRKTWNALNPEAQMAEPFIWPSLKATLSEGVVYLEVRGERGTIAPAGSGYRFEEPDLPCDRSDNPEEPAPAAG